MLITNKLNLPEPIVAAVRNDPYDAGSSDISVTRLIAPPQLVALVKQHSDEIVEDASERIWALLGQAVHTILERADMSGITEERLYMEVLGWSVSGQMDRLVLLPTKVLSDYKVTSVWAIKDGPKPEWEQQLNCLRVLCCENGYLDINRLEVVAILRDFSKFGRFKYGRGYPKYGIATIPVRMWPMSEAKRFIEDRVRRHQLAQEGFVPPCTPEECWARPTKYAVIKPGAKRASRVFETQEEAEKLAGKVRADVEVRLGELVRCASYCPVGRDTGFCSQWKEAQRDGPFQFGGDDRQRDP